MYLSSLLSACKIAAAVTSVERIYDYDKLLLLVYRTSVREMIQSSVVCLMVMDLTAIWLLRE
jgi:hypothetical protein